MIRFQLDDRLPSPLAIGLGLQQVELDPAGIVLNLVIVVRDGHGSETYPT